MAKKRMCPCPPVPADKARTILRLARTCAEKSDAAKYLGRTLAAQRDALPPSRQAAFDKHARAETDKAFRSARRACGESSNDRFARARAGLFGY